jgi:DNA-binding transcriptional MocR family regulator
MLLGLDRLGIGHTRPEGGLFVWAWLPEGQSALTLLEAALERGVAFVPGTHFYCEGGHENTLRLNFSNSAPDQIDQGLRALGEAIQSLQ